LPRPNGEAVGEAVATTDETEAVENADENVNSENVGELETENT
jgi:hypothetical protein